MRNPDAVPYMPKLNVPPRSSRTSRTASRARPMPSTTRAASGRNAVRLGERDPASRPDEEVDAELGLELPDLLGERRLRDVERPRGGRERAVLGGGESPPGLERHRPMLSIM